MTKNQPLEERFMSKVEIDEDTGCWPFKSSLSQKGYGRFFLNGRSREAYRVAYELFIEKVEKGLHLHHICENPPCVNPNHLVPVTNREHHVNLTSNHIAYKNARKTHCPYGHKLIDKNLVSSAIKRGARICLTCARRRARDCQRRLRLRKRQQKTGEKNAVN